jgi:hypothetical protein
MRPVEGECITPWPLKPLAKYSPRTCATAMIGNDRGHFVKPGPGAFGIHFDILQARHAIHGAGKNFSTNTGSKFVL